MKIVLPAVVVIALVMTAPALAAPCASLRQIFPGLVPGSEAGGPIGWAAAVSSRAHGLLHGWTDRVVSPLATIDYYESLVDQRLHHAIPLMEPFPRGV